jgi:hypothetical protein
MSLRPLRCLVLCLLCVVCQTGIHAQSFLMMPDSTNNRMVLFDPVTGSVVNNNYFALAGGTTVHALQVGNEIWVSEQLGDRVSRWSLTGTPLGAIGPTYSGGGFDNIRGMGLVNNTVYVTNAGTANGAPGVAVVLLDTAGNFLSSFSTVGTAPSPFGVLAFQGDILVSSASANNDIHRYTLAGSSVGAFHNSGTLNFVEQLYRASNGDVLAATFSSNLVARLDSTNGNILNQFAASGARGVWELGNGNILWTSGSGAFVYDGTSSTQVYTGGGRYIDLLTIAAVPEPGTIAMIGTGVLAGVLVIRRKWYRRKATYTRVSK